MVGFAGSGRREAAIVAVAAAACLLPSLAMADPALDQQLCAASQSGASADIRRLLQQGADPNATCANKAGDDHFGPLYLAVGIDAADGVGALLDAGARVATPETKYGLSAVFKIRSQAVGELLFSRGADVNARNARGETPIQYLSPRIGGTFTEDTAAAVGAVLLAHGANVNDTFNDSTPLMQAVTFEETTLVAFLLDHKADPNWRDKNGETALGLAIRLEGELKPEFAEGYRATQALLRAHGAVQ